MNAQGVSPIGLAIAPSTPRPLAAGGRYRNDPYCASVLPQLQPQPPTTQAHSQPSTARVPLPPVHAHHHHTTPLLHHRGGFASRMKGDVARASAAFVDEEDPIATSGAATFAYVRFKHDSCCYHIPPSSSCNVRSGDYVVVDADRGMNAGMVERVTHDSPSYPVHSQVMRFATHEEVMALTCLRLEEREVLDYVQEAAEYCGLNMRVVDVEFQFDRRKLTIYFEAAAMVDFRRLQRALFKQYGCRIWLVLWRDVHRGGGQRR